MIITKTLISGDNCQPGLLSKERSRASSSYNVKVSTLILIKWKWKLGRNLQNEMMSNLSAGENQTSLQGETPALHTGDFLIFLKLGTCQMFVNFVKVKLLLTGCSKKGQSWWRWGLTHGYFSYIFFHVFHISIFISFLSWKTFWVFSSA